MTNVLIAGGAGYIGSVVTRKFLEAGYTVVVLDNLSKGDVKLILPEVATFCHADLCDKDKLQSLFSVWKFDIVVNCAGYKAVGESMSNAIKYSDNITGLINLMNACVEYKVKKFIFSSSASVYGEGIPGKILLDEKDTGIPTSFYGHTKLESERLLEWYKIIYGLDYVALRYFNVAGDAGFNYIDPDAQNIFPIIAEYLSGKRDKFTIFGNDYPTHDGTCVRDYIHVDDLARAHLNATNVKGSEIINLGSGKGISVQEIVDCTNEIIGNKLFFNYGPRRAGDPAFLVANNSKALELMFWSPKYSLKEMVESTLKAYKIV